MTSFTFIIGLGILIGVLYFYTNKRVSKKETEFNDFAYKMQKDFLDNTPTVHNGVTYFKKVELFYTQKGYTLSKHPDFSTDYIAKQGNEIVFVRLQAPGIKQDITAKVIQNFVGQTVLPVLDDTEHNIAWHYVCSKMMCDRSAKVLLAANVERLKFELVEA